MNYCSESLLPSLTRLLKLYDMELVLVADDQAIPGSFWGDQEAGLIENRLYVRHDTPIHSALHEACHYICMDAHRRKGLHTDAGGGYDEENGVCYLQILLSEHIDTIQREDMFKDMDDWGYSFRLGSTQAWFNRDAEDALAWLHQHRLLDDDNLPNWRLRI